MNNNRLPPLNSLKAFEAAARHESFLEAAAKQGVTSGSISRHVRLLERYLGTELFVRRSNGVTLTSAGKEIRREGQRHSQGPESRDGSRPQAVGRPRDRDLDPPDILGTLALPPHSVIQGRRSTGRSCGSRFTTASTTRSAKTWMRGSCIRKDSIPATVSRGCSQKRCFPSAARNSARRCPPTPAPTRSSANPCCTTCTGTPTGRTGPGPSAQRPANLPPTCAFAL